MKSLKIGLCALLVAGASVSFAGNGDVDSAENFSSSGSGPIEETRIYVGTTRKEGKTCALKISSMTVADYMSGEPIAARASVDGDGIPLSLGNGTTKITHSFRLIGENWGAYSTLLRRDADPNLQIQLPNERKPVASYYLTIDGRGTINCDNMHLLK